MDSTERYDLGKNASLKRRYERTIKFVEASLQPPLRILDLGIQNPLSQLLASKGFEIVNTGGEDLDESPQSVSGHQVDVVTAFEIFEHLLNPLSVIKALPGDKLIASVPLRLWFAKAYRHPSDEWDRHYHEFEDWQFDWLLDKAGWKVVRREKWASPISKLGIRPLLRLITNRYYIIEAVRKNTKL
ncbi:MAG: methyltransferase [Cyclobacteriaceae bacterium]|nr:methyltransferase [Cyclobacteriaceae bacterium]